MRVISKKIPGGKLLRIRARTEEKNVFQIQLSGDFFLAPPEGIHALEEALEGFNATDKQAIIDVLEYVMKRDNIRVDGFSPANVAELLGELIQ